MKLNYFNCLLITFMLSIIAGHECFAQGKSISGKVTGADGSSLPGVNVVVKGTTTGTVTNLDGQYSISAGESDVLVFSFIGFLSEEVAVGTQSTIDVLLMEDMVGLSEVVVIGYGTVKKSDVTGAMVSISSDILQEQPVQNALQAIQGKAAGVDIFTNTRPGEVPNVRIRGNKSLTATEAQKQPLYVVDGIIHLGTLNDINPNDIQSMDILKDASATAIYGSRGANGVVLITTKHGSKGVVSVNYNGVLTLDNIHSLTDWAESGELLDRKRTAYQNGKAYNSAYPDPALDIQRFGNNDYWTINAIRQGYEWNDPGTYADVMMRPTTQEEKDMGWPDEVPVYNGDNIPSYDWLDELTRTGKTYDQNISISSGSENGSVYFSFGYLDNTGPQLNQSFKRYTSKLNAEINVKDWMKFGASLSATKSEQEYGTINRSGSATGARDLYGLALGMYPMAQPYDTLGELINYPGNNAGAPLWNPIIDIDNTQDLRMVSNFQANLFGEVNFTPWLKYRINVGSGIRTSRKGTWQGKESTLRRGAELPTAEAALETDFASQWMIENLVYADKTLGVHNFGITLLQSAQGYQLEQEDMAATQLINDSPKWNDLGANLNGNLSGYQTAFEENYLTSYMGRVNYGLMDKYLFTATIRSDGASVLAPDHKWDYFPSGAFAWKIHNENFLKSITAISELKLRLTYGIIGNASIDPYVSSGPLQQYNYIYGTTVAIGYIPGDMANQLLSWEKTGQVNLGLDFGLMNGRVSGTLELYKSNIYDLLLYRELPPIVGYTNTWFNIGKMENQGIELTLNTVNVSNSDFSWKTNLTFFAEKEKIVELLNGEEDMPNAGGLNGVGWYIGQPANVYRNYEVDGIWQDTPEDSVEMANWRNIGGIIFTPGTYKPVDQNNNYMLNDSDKVILGSPNPKWTGGITNTFKYKNVKLSFFIYAKVGQKYFANLNPGGAGAGTFIGYARHEDPDNFWSPENPDAEYPMPSISPANGDIYRATYIHDGSFAVMRNISLSYDLPKSLLERVKINNVEVFAQVLNPFIIGGDVLKAGFNPDDSNGWNTTNTLGEPQGGTNNNTVIIKSWVFGIRVGL